MASKSPDEKFIYNLVNTFMSGMYSQVNDIKEILHKDKSRVSATDINKVFKALEDYVKAEKMMTDDFKKRIDELSKVLKSTKQVNGGDIRTTIRTEIEENIRARKNGEATRLNLSGDSDLAKKLKKRYGDAEEAVSKFTKATADAASKIEKMFRQPNFSGNNNGSPIGLSGLGSNVNQMTAGSQNPVTLNKATNNSIKNGFAKLGAGIKNFFLGSAFWGKFASGLATGILNSGILKNTLADSVKLLILMGSSVLRNLFGKHVGGIAAIVAGATAEIVGAIVAWNLTMRGFKALFGLGKAKNVANGGKLINWVKGIFSKGSKGSAPKGSFVKAMSSGAMGDPFATKSMGMAAIEGLEGVSKTTTATKAAGDVTKFASAMKSSNSILDTAGKWGGKAWDWGKKAWAWGGKLLDNPLSQALAKSPLLKTAGKIVPFAGTAIGVANGIDRWKKGEKIAAGAELLSAGLWQIKNPWTMGAAAAIDLGLLGHDWIKKKYGDKGVKKVGYSMVGGLAGSLLGPLGAGLGSYLGGKIADKGIEGTLKEILEIMKKVWNFLDAPRRWGAQAATAVSNAYSGAKEWVQDLGAKITGSDSVSKYRVSGKYGEARYKTVNGQKVLDHYHGGTDYAMPKGTPVQARLGGRVVKAESMGAYGNTVVIDHGDAFGVYAHLDSIPENIRNKVGKKGAEGLVSMDDLIAFSGDSGSHGQYHLHNEVRMKSSSDTLFNQTNGKAMGRVAGGMAVDPDNYYKSKRKQEVTSFDSTPTSTYEEVINTPPGELYKCIMDQLTDSIAPIIEDKSKGSATGGAAPIDASVLNDSTEDTTDQVARATLAFGSMSDWMLMRAMVPQGGC